MLTPSINWLTRSIRINKFICYYVTRDVDRLYVIDKGFFSEAFLFKPRGGRSPPSGFNRKPRKNPLFSL